MVRNPKFRRGVPQTPDARWPGGARAMSNDSLEAMSLLWVGRILHVDSETMVCSIQLESGTGERFDVPLPAPGGAGPRSWSGNLPEKNAKCVIGWRKYGPRSYVPYIVEWMTVGVYGAREYEPFMTADPEDAAEALRIFPDMELDPHYNLTSVRLKLRKAYAGDWTAQASGGADALLDRNAHLANRAGNEFFLRDADQTAVLQTVNEFKSNAAGTYVRGIIRRSSFDLQPDLAISGFDPSEDSYEDFIAGKLAELDDRTLVAMVEPGSAAYDNLLAQGLINEDGTVVEAVGSDPGELRYPFDVLPDGRRASTVVMGEQDVPFSATDQAYVEDRLELRHTSDGIMAVTEGGDGVQIDDVPPVFIEDVKGTVVGNDPYTEPGRALYKRILTMRVFDDTEQQSNSPAPIFEPVDVVTSQTEADTRALARLFRVQSPTSSNQFAFGITKEGRALLHIPKARTGSPDEKGKSLDANLLGLLKAVIGMDENTGRSIDLTTLGGIRAEIGAFQDDSDPANPEQVSLDLVLHGKIRTTYAGTQGRESFVGGSDYRGVSGSTMDVVGGNAVRNVGGSESVEATSITHNAGFGGLKTKTAGDMNNTVLGKTSELYAQLRQSTFALSDTKTMLAGVDSTTVLVGGISRTVATGTGITDTVAAGPYAATAAAGAMSFNVGVGSYSATVGAGSLALTAGAGAATLTGGVSATMASGAIANIAAPITKIGFVPVGFVVAGIPGPPLPHRDYVTGVPILGIPTVIIGP